jgi:serine/threonine-protein kinase
VSGSGASSPPKYKLCPACRHIYPATNNFCPQDQKALIVSEDIIAGRYVLSQRVGAGAMGTVYMAEDTQLGRRVALKLLKPAHDAQLRIDREAKAVGGLDHDNVVRVYERGQHDDGRLYIAMEYLEGESLRSYLATQGRLPLRQALELWVQAVRGVAAAHKKHVIHRDLKPDNLFLARREQDDGHLEQLKILDFGIAQIRSEKPTRGTVRIGTPGYVAPEQWMHGEATARSDVYSLGVILLEMLTGLRSLAANPQAPLEALERLAIAHTVSPELRQLLAAVLAPEPAQRPADARVLLERLRSLSDGQLVRPSGAIAAPLPGPLSLATSGAVARRPPSGDELQPLDADEDQEDTEQVGLESLRPPAPTARPAGKGLPQATVRVERLPGLVPTTATERSTAGPPEAARAALAPERPELEPPPIPSALAEQITGQVPPPAVSEAGNEAPGEPALDLLAEEVTAGAEARPDHEPTNQLPLPAQSTLILGSAAQMPTLNLSAFTAEELKEAAGRSDPKSSPGKAPATAARVLSGRPRAATLPAGAAETLPLGSFASYRQPSEAPRGLRAWLATPTPLGSAGRVLLVCAVLGLLAVVAIGFLF